MERKINIISKINNISFFVVIVSVFTELYIPFFKWITIFSSCSIYISILLLNKLKFNKFDKIMVILCSLSLVWLFLREFFSSPFISILGLFIVYSFLLWSFKVNVGKWNYFIIVFGSLTIFLSILNVIFDFKWISYLIIGLQLVIVFKFLDPILERIGLEHREQRLAHERKMKEQAETKGIIETREK